MRTIKILLGVTVAVVGVFVVKWMMSKPDPTHGPAQVNQERNVTSEVPKLPPVTSITSPLSQPTAPVRAAATPSALATKPVELNTAPVAAQVKKPKEPLRDPDARMALSFVGADPTAEAYWLGAIFDSNLPENEREDLMEDLNEDGLSDAKHPGPQDLPLILNRLVLIENILPYADDFMVEHLGEAYKDLANLAAVTQGNGVPVR